MTLNEFVFGWAPVVVLGVIILAVGAAVFWRMLAARAELAIQRKSRLLCPAERSFFECLNNALNDEYYIFTKVRMLDIVEPSPAANRIQTRGLYQGYSEECLDYVLCKKLDLSIFGVVELENFEKQNDPKVREQREKKVSDLCKAANLRLFYFDIRQDYKDMDIRRLITGRSRPSSGQMSATHQSQLTIDGATVTEFGNARSCPKCHSEVVTKVAVKGSRIGEKFLMCRKYPYCDYKLPIDDEKVLKMQKKEQHKAAKPGFGDWSPS
jgi:hypothetical protein